VRKKLILIITLIILLVIIDQTMKIVSINIWQNQDISLGFLNLTYSKNTGIALGIAKNNIFGIITTEVIVIGILISFLVKQFRNVDIKTGIFMSMILAGGISNLIDRIFYGGVVDYLNITKLIKTFPIFNIADCIIIIGLILFTICTFKNFANIKNGKFNETNQK